MLSSSDAALSFDSDTAPLFDVARLTPKERTLLEAHLQESVPGTGASYESLYREFAAESKSQDLVWVRRGAQRELVWRLHRTNQEPVRIPPVVAKAITAEDTTDPLAMSEHRRDSAHRSWQKLVEARTTRRKRITEPERRTAVEKENTAYGKWLTAEADHLTKKAELALAEYRDLLLADADRESDAFVREMDRMFDAERAYMELPPLAERIETAKQAAARMHREAADTRGKVRAWNSPGTQTRLRNGAVVQL
ncbi:hypothetical protein [Leifsonia sp. Leaf264]|uniref:hypothetical protein n=1 Tax=Leifsonia sp. Leaf264 TaxID=1736314 RepID=UPI0006F5D9FB|nr:hypothetical protein [Leifsonia sp. Leaf264]KQO98750.1 hypothetical protein ASF30_11860 [Leifsonia sp. Leaf264]